MGDVSSVSSASPTFAQWLAGARPHTWANAVSPVVFGSGAAAFAGGFSWWRALLALIVAVALIIGVNFANDYSDGIRGTDDDRSGPLRLTASGLAAPGAVKRAAFGAFAVAGVAGIALSLASFWWFILIGAACIAGAWFYTGGKNPYGYRGLGEVAVFVFFGLVAVLGTEATQAGAVSWVGLVGAVSIGAISASVNLVNNLRDIPSDSATGKITLAVRLGDANSRRLYLILANIPLVGSLLLIPATPFALLTLVAAPMIWTAARPVLQHATGKALIPVLGATGRGMLMWSLASTIVLAFGA